MKEQQLSMLPTLIGLLLRSAVFAWKSAADTRSKTVKLMNRIFSERLPFLGHEKVLRQSI